MLINSTDMRLGGGGWQWQGGGGVREAVAGSHKTEDVDTELAHRSTN